MERLIGLIPVENLSPHILHKEIYGDPDENIAEFEDLKSDIAANGILQPLIVDQFSVVISGSRRLAAAKSLGIKSVPVESLHFEGEADRIQWIVSQNAYRLKTKIQRMKEARIIEGLIEKLAIAKKHHKDLNDTEVLRAVATNEGKVVTRDEVGKAVGLGPRTYQDGKKALEIADKLRAEGQEDKAVEIETKMETSISGARKLAEESVEKPEDPHKILYWYLQYLQKISSVMRRNVETIRAKSNSTTPAALTNFMGNLERTIEAIETWNPTKMMDCPICNGTMFVKDQACQNCIQGKVGKYTLPPRP
jgi:ParB-like chromosome segregation protein Spo0J